MIKIRRADERGHADHGWLNTYHTFSFAGYYDPAHMGFRHLRVINEDRVQPGQGFGMHPHRDMEIISYVVSGTMAHADSQEHRSITRAGEVQQMSAGSGIRHTEMNASDEDELHFLQIWIEPNQTGVTPRYQHKSIGRQAGQEGLFLIASPDGSGASLSIHQDVYLSVGFLNSDSVLNTDIEPNRHAWVQLIRGQLDVNGVAMQPGDGCSISEIGELTFSSNQNAEFLLFDLA